MNSSDQHHLLGLKSTGSQQLRVRERNWISVLGHQDRRRCKVVEQGSCQVKDGRRWIIPNIVRKLTQTWVWEQVRQQSLVMGTPNGRTTGRTDFTSHPCFLLITVELWVRVSLKTGVDAASMPLGIVMLKEVTRLACRATPLLKTLPSKSMVYTCHGLYSLPKSAPYPVYLSQALFLLFLVLLLAFTPSLSHTIYSFKVFVQAVQCAWNVLPSFPNLLLCIFKFYEIIKRPSLSPSLGSIFLFRC